MEKEQEILLYSDPEYVLNKFNKWGLNKRADLFLSTRKDKKYMVIMKDTGKKIHFGAMGYEDYSKHKDEWRRLKFQNRNRKWAAAIQFTPAFLSFYLLWN